MGKTGRARTKQVGSGLSKFAAKVQQIFEICNFFYKKSRIASGTIDIEKDGGKNATERNNEGTPTDSRHNGRI